MFIESIKNGFEFFIDKSQSRGKKAWVFIIAFILFILFEGVFKMSYNVHLNNKINQLHNVSEMLSYNVEDDSVKKFIENKKIEILDRKHYSHYIKEFYGSLSEKIAHIIKPNKSDIIKEDKISDKLSIWYTVLSGSFFLIITWVIFLLSPIFSTSNVFSNIFDLIAATVIMGILITILTAIFMLIPIIYNPIINYILYFLLQTIGFVYIGKKV